MQSRKSIARIAGILYLAYFIAFFLADNGVHYTAVASVDPAAQVQAITAAPGQFRIGFVSFLVSAAMFLLSAWALYRLLKTVDQDLALLFLLLNLAGVAIKCTSLISEWAVLLLASGGEYAQAFPPDQRQALAMLFLNVYRHGFLIAQLFFGIWLLPLGYLVFKSGFLPKWLGILLMIDCFAILIWFFQFFLFPGYEGISYLCLAESFIAEAALCLWLLVKGVRTAPALTKVE